MSRLQIAAPLRQISATMEIPVIAHQIAHVIVLEIAIAAVSKKTVVN